MNDDPVINGYEIISKIGNGAMGAVYKARQTNLDRIVAIKILSRDPGDEQADLVGRFQREARVAAGLQHPGIVQVFDAGQAGEKHYFAMEFVEGQSVGDKLKSEEKLSEDETLQIALAIAKAMDYAWTKAGVIHRDIKPDNILIDKEGTVKVADLGLVKVRTVETTTLTMTGLVMGTPCYCSPEQAKGDEPPDCRSDIYSLGSMIYHCTTGGPPFGKGSGIAAMVKHVTEHVLNPKTFNQNLSEGLVWLVEKMMMKNKEHRQQDWKEVIADIEHVIQFKTPNGPAPQIGLSTLKRDYFPKDFADHTSDTIMMSGPDTRNSSLAAGNPIPAAPPSAPLKTEKTRSVKRKSRKPVLVILILLAILVSAPFIYDRYEIRMFIEKLKTDAGKAVALTETITAVPAEKKNRLLKKNEKPTKNYERYTFGGAPRARTYPYPIKILENKAYLTGYCEHRKNPVWVAYKLFPPKSEGTGRASVHLKADRRTKSAVSPADYKLPENSNAKLVPGQLVSYASIAACYDSEAAGETFLMSNITPQDIRVRSKTWIVLEQRLIEQLRDLQAEAWVICGPVFGKNPKSLPSGVFIPDAMFKITVLTSKDRTPRFAAILVTQPDPKTGAPKVMRIGLNRLEELTGFEFFPDTPGLFPDQRQ